MDRFSLKVRRALEYAFERKEKDGFFGVTSAHILAGIMKFDSEIASDLLEEYEIYSGDVEEFIEEVVESLSSNVAQLPYDSGFFPEAEQVMAAADREASKEGSALVQTKHVLLAMVKDVDCIAYAFFKRSGINIRRFYVDLMIYSKSDSDAPEDNRSNRRGGPEGPFGAGENEKKQKNGKKGKSSTPTLDQYSRDLTELAAENKLDPVIGRDDEIARVIQILSRRTKNNPCLIGEPGVGKTAIAEGLALKIVEGNVPESVQGKRLVTLDISTMVAGTKYRGEFEERITDVIREVTEDKNVLLFIDEIHTIIGAGSAEGSMDACNILKPAMARGELQIIGATTTNEYRKHIEKDAALERRFQPVVVNEPSEDETIEILKELRKAYEEHHHVQITDDALIAATKLSARYINDRFLPDKAIDLMDEASSKLRLSAFVTPEEVKEMEAKCEQLEKDKQAAVGAENFEKAGELKKRIREIQEQRRVCLENWEKQKQESRPIVGTEEIADIVSGWTGIPVKTLEQGEKERLRNMENILRERVIGQDEALAAVSRAIRRGRIGLKDPSRPIGSFLFLGPTGVGKTETCKALAQSMFGTENSIIRVDMSEYMDKESVNKMIGSPPGYIGYDEGGQLSEKVRRHPYSIILFDEVEKAHPDIFNILLQVLDEGRITDSQGRRIDFKNTIIIMTSNLGAKNILTPKSFGFAGAQNEQAQQEAEYKVIREQVMEDVKQAFRPEFLNRIDETIVFHPLNRDNMGQILEIMLKEIKKRAKDNANLELTISEEAKKLLMDKGFDAKYGARPLKRTLQSMLEDKMAEELLEEKIKEGDRVLADVNEDHSGILLKCEDEPAVS